MRNVLPKYLIVLALLFIVGFVFVKHTRATANYSNSSGNFTFSFDDNQGDFGDCAGTTFWKINLSYNDGTEVQGSGHSVDTTSATDSFNIPNGTAIQIIELWGAFTEEDLIEGNSCQYQIANNSSGVFTWDAAAQISDILVSDVTSSSVKVSWTTDDSADSTVYYGTTTSYGSTASDGTATTSHSVTLTGLSASTTYHYKVKSDSAESGDNTFATPATGESGSNQSGSTTTTVTATPTPTPLPDRTGPAVSIITKLEKPFLTPPKISGTASDASGVVNVEYSLDDGRNWNAVDVIPNLGAKSVSFTFTPPPLDDDNYKVRVRATDNADARNVGVSQAYTLIIDRLPPAIGGNIISIGPQVLFPNNAGYLLTTTGIKQKITLSAVGGPTQITLSAHPLGASSSAQTYELNRNPDNGLWSGILMFANPGIYQLEAKSIDGAGNETVRQINKIAVIEPGRILDPENKGIKDATIKLYYFEEKYQLWRLWDGPSYEQKNPVKTDTDGEFSYLLPPGRYYFEITAGGFRYSVSEIFSIEKPTLINPTFTLKPLKLLFDFGLFKLYFPDFSTNTLPIKLSLPQLPSPTNSLLEKGAPQMRLKTTDNTYFELFANRGTPLVVSFMNLWTPQTTEQIAALDRISASNFKGVAVFIGTSLDKATLFKKNGNYKTTIAVDPDGTMIEDYQVNTLPTHYFIDRRGVIKQIITGVLNEEELQSKLLEIQ